VTDHDDDDDDNDDDDNDPPVPSFSLDPKLSLNTVFYSTLSLCSSFTVTYQVPHPCRTTDSVL